MADAPTVNKDELARLLKVSKPTLDGWLKDYPDFPVVSGGSRGVPYAFDVEAVIAWRTEKTEAARQAATEKTELLAQFEFEVETQPGESAAASPAQRLQIAKSLQVERKLAIEAGQLVFTAGMRQALQVALTLLGKDLDNIPGQLGREINLPDAGQRAVRRYLDDTRARLVKRIKDAMGAQAELDDRESLFDAAE